MNNILNSTIAAADKRRVKKELARMKMMKLLNEGIAPLVMGENPQLKARKRTLDKIDKKIVDLYKAKELIQVLPVGVMLLLRASVTVDADKFGHTGGVHEIDLVVTIKTINEDSVRCILWTQERSSWETRQIIKDRGDGMRPIKLTHINQWRKWTQKDSALTINHEFQSKAYKRLAYGCQ